MVGGMVDEFVSATLLLPVTSCISYAYVCAMLNICQDVLLDTHNFQLR
jgi:hypothetical protein